MSFFYFFPAKGDIPVHLLETIVLNRLNYLRSLFENQHLPYNEYTIEGSVYDNVGHFISCILAILDGSSDFSNFLIRAEEALFKHRLAQLTAYDLRCLSKKILKGLKKLNVDLQLLDPLYLLCRKLMVQSVAHHITTICDDKCFLHKIEINFKYCLKLVAKREVVLNNGLASIHCCQWRKLMVMTFAELLKHRIYGTHGTLIKNDPRINQLFQTIKKKFNHFQYNENINILKSHQVDSKSKFFPPCMLNLHQHLRMRHRLSHNERFYYSLFLKDIGMPIEESVKFWKLEYCQEPRDTCVCCHNWNKDEKKYLYGIRHLYGLEGGRKTYWAKGCQFIQNSDNSYSEGGCPFKCFDVEKMQQVLSLDKEDSMFQTICNLKEQKKYTMACKLYLNHKFPNCDSSYSFSPVKYYSQARNQKCLDCHK
ncbi:DNA primase large subunit-like [Aricia agestis]|uniref:DNA primase large subunit-like n=1 Tax=Aricia agestis TaxID=91739 RepID=UPI001C203274|nr:DNA primase large subunit-like [Aricia agestis]